MFTCFTSIPGSIEHRNYTKNKCDCKETGRNTFRNANGGGKGGYCCRMTTRHACSTKNMVRLEIFCDNTSNWNFNDLRKNVCGLCSNHWKIKYKCRHHSYPSMTGVSPMYLQI